jgi:hypothetical protein
MATPYNVPDADGDQLGLILNPWQIGDYRQWKNIGLGGRNTPQSDRIRRQMDSYIPTVNSVGLEPDDLFDRFEYLMCLNHGYELYRDQTSGTSWVPFGRFTWRRDTNGDRMSAVTKFSLEANSMRDQWGPIKAGFFGGTFEGYERAKEISDEFFARLGPTLR